MKAEAPGRGRIEYRGLDRRAQRVAEARRLLQCMKPYERWERGLSPALRATMVGAFGSTLGAYTTMRDGVEQEAEDPAPTTILVRPDGSLVLSWE